MKGQNILTVIIGVALVALAAGCGAITPPSLPSPLVTAQPPVVSAAATPSASEAAALSAAEIRAGLGRPGATAAGVGEQVAAISAAPITPTLPGQSAEAFTLFRSGSDLFAGRAVEPTPQAMSGTMQGAGTGQANLTPFVQLFPELRRMPAPAWLREGHRTTYYVQSASVPQAANARGSSGAGYVQYDLVALDANSAVVSSKFYLDEGKGSVTPNTVTASFGIPAAGDYWLNPAVLENARRVASNELAVVRMPTTIGGHTFQAVRFQYTTAGAEYVWMFDEETGILLFYRHAIGTENDQYRQLADATLVHQRQVVMPWRGRTAPAWAKVGATLQYEGTYSTLIPGSPALSMPYAARATITGQQTRWSLFKVTDYLYGRQNTSLERVTGVGQVSDALWLPREALRTALIRPWRDRDPVTGAETVLSRTRDGHTVLTEKGDTYASSLTYDGQTGALVSMRLSTQVGLATNAIELNLVD